MRVHNFDGPALRCIRRNAEGAFRAASADGVVAALPDSIPADWVVADVPPPACEVGARYLTLVSATPPR
jgi:hypothetical protein